jgi:hypothetical protein
MLSLRNRASAVARLRTRAAASVCLLAVVAVAGCADQSGWGKGISQTSCTDWTNSMTAQDRASMAGSKLDAVRGGGYTITGSGDDLASSVTSLCSAPNGRADDVNTMSSLILSTASSSRTSIQTAGAALASSANGLAANAGQ